MSGSRAVDASLDSSTSLNKSVECAVLFADVSDSTGLYARYGDARAHNVLSQCVATMSEIGRRYGGVVVKTIGDEVMCRFAAADQAVHAASGIQETLEYRERFDGVMLAAHIGLHVGSAFADDGDVHGDAVNVAASMTTIAKPRQIITTQDTVARLPPQLAALTRLYDIVTLKGNRREMSVYEVLWEQENVTSILTRTDLKAQTVISRIHLSYKSCALMVTKDMPVVLMGRSQDCNLVVDAKLVSRVHARIEYRRDKFVLVDDSTNGTFVKPENGREIYLRREEMPLWGRGHISLAGTTRHGTGEFIYYSAQ